MVTCPSPARTTLPLRRTQSIVVERIFSSLNRMAKTLLAKAEIELARVVATPFQHNELRPMSGWRHETWARICRLVRGEQTADRTIQENLSSSVDSLSGLTGAAPRLLRLEAQRSWSASPPFLEEAGRSQGARPFAWR